MLYLRQSTAATVTVGPFVGTDGLTPNASLTDQSANARLATNGTGAAFTASSWTVDGSLGHYAVGLSTAHTGTVGRLRLAFSLPATYAPVWEDYEVLAQAVYDVLFGTVAPAVAGSAMALTSGERTTLAGVIGADVSDTVGADVVAIKAKTDNLPTDPASNTAVNTRLAASAYTAPPTDYQQRGVAVTLPALPGIPGGVVQTGSTASAVILSGLPAGKKFVGAAGVNPQYLLDTAQAEYRKIASQAYNSGTGNYTLTLDTGDGEWGPFSDVPATGSTLYICR